MKNDKYLNERRQKIVKGLEATYVKLVEFKKLKRSPLIVSKDGEILEIEPDRIQPTTTYFRKKSK